MSKATTKPEAPKTWTVKRLDGLRLVRPVVRGR